MSLIQKLVTVLRRRLSFPDNYVLNTNDGYTLFDGFSNYMRFGDYLDSVWAANDTYFELQATFKDVPLTGIKTLYSKLFITGNQRAFLLWIVNSDVNFLWYADGGSSNQRGVTWANAIPDTNAHTILLKYNGAIDTNNGLDRVVLEIDGVVAGSKTLTSSPGSMSKIFDATSQLAIGATVEGVGTVTFASMFNGNIKNLIARDAGGIIFQSLSQPYSNGIGTYMRSMQPIVDNTMNAAAVDTCQTTVNCLIDTGTHYYLYYLASNPVLVPSDVDVTCMAILPKGNAVTTGWVKRLSAGLPEIIYNVGGAGKFDEKQVWLRNVRKKDDGTYEAWPVGQSVADTFAMGYSTSPDGIVWTRQNSGNAVYSDGSTDFTLGHIILDPVDGKYRMLYVGNQLGTAVSIADSSDGLTWTRTHTEILRNEGLGWAIGFKKFDGYYYLWFAKRQRFFSGISHDIVAFRTLNFVTFEYLGTQVRAKGSNEFGLTSTVGLAQKANGDWFMVYTVYKNKIGKVSNLGEEFTQIKVAELNRSDLPIAGRMCTYIYPTYVIEHYPLNRGSNSGLNFEESISGTNAVINTTPVFTQDAAYGSRDLGFVDLSGSQNITKSASGVFTPSDFAIKLRVEIITTGTHELFRVGTDSDGQRCLILSLVSGKLRIRLSADGTNWTKDYITTANISKPANMSYVDNHIYVAIRLNGGTLKMYNDFVEFTSGQITKTLDAAITVVANHTANRTIGSNATLEVRAVSILSGSTEAELIALDI